MRAKPWPPYWNWRYTGTMHVTFSGFRLLAICLALLCNDVVLADQTDPRLDGLFDQLRQNTDPESLLRTENAIWDIWLQHSNPDVERLLQLGNQSMNLENYPDALLIFNQLVESYPDYAEAWNKRATLHYLLGDFDQSIADIERTLALEPRHFGAWSGLGLVHLRRQDLNAARSAFLSMLSVHPHSPNGQRNLELVEQALQFDVI